MNTNTIIENLFLVLPLLKSYHKPGSRIYDFLKQTARNEVEGLFRKNEECTKEFKPFGKLLLPYCRMGSVDSLDLFDIDELIIFSFYWKNRNRYKNILDIGANIGLHSIILSKCNLKVRAYEPDPQHFEILRKNLKLNDCVSAEIFNTAVSDKAGEAEFIRVLGNTTSSHIAGAKADPYGELEKFIVKTEAIGSVIDWADLIKLDAEGQEKKILLSINRKQWLQTDALVEIESEKNAEAIYDHFAEMDVNLFSQKMNWQKVRETSDMPVSYREGTLFVSCKETMPWE